MNFIFAIVGNRIDYSFSSLFIIHLNFFLFVITEMSAKWREIGFHRVAWG